MGQSVLPLYRCQKLISLGCLPNLGGNAGLAAAYSARKLNIPCTVVVPGTTPTFMVERLREEGATVEICGNVSCLLIPLQWISIPSRVV